MAESAVVGIPDPIKGESIKAYVVVKAGVYNVAESLREMCGGGFAGLIVTTGGTGFAPRDQTPEGTRQVIEREAPGLAEAMRLVNPLGRLSRGIAGVRGRTIICNTPAGGPANYLHNLATYQGDV